uniref:Putative secreted protein n=1 Tax=Anopheles marajoara TaxID=58244 RepID=A0A2M4CC03_9DIPT
MIRLICWLLFSSSFSCLLRFSRKSGLSIRQSINSSGCSLTIVLPEGLHTPVFTGVLQLLDVMKSDLARYQTHTEQARLFSRSL